ncbi:MAG: ribosome-associated translation inhibitor RaiA [Dehalococcoidia bacterium]
MMEVLIKSRNLELAEEARAYIRTKIDKLERYLPNMDEVKVELSHEKAKAADKRFVVQVTITSHGTLLRGEERAANVNAAIDNVIDVLSRQIERFKGKLYRSQRKKSPSAVKGLSTEDMAQEEPIRITRVKRFPIGSMSPEEAADRMEFLGHNFFLFFNEEGNEFNVLYRRNDGSYGVIEPEFA